MTSYRVGLAAAALLVGTTAAPAAHAEDTGLRPGWSFEFAPYIWLPSLDGTLRYSLPAALGGTADVKANPDDYFSNLNFAAAFVASARYDRFTLLTDFMYINADAGASHVGAVNIAGVPGNPITSTQDAGTSSNLKGALWTLAGGYTIASGSWGNVDVIGGFRYFGAEAETNYNLSVQLFGPRGNAGPSFGGSGRLSARQDIWNGIVGARGRLRIGQSGFFVPYYVDVGTGDFELHLAGLRGRRIPGRVGRGAAWLALHVLRPGRQLSCAGHVAERRLPGRQFQLLNAAARAEEAARWQPGRQRRDRYRRCIARPSYHPPNARRRTRPCGPPCRGSPTQAGRRRRTAHHPSASCRQRMPRGRLASCRSATRRCSPRLSPTIAVRLASWRPTSREPPSRAFALSQQRRAVHQDECGSCQPIRPQRLRFQLPVDADCTVPREGRAGPKRRFHILWTSRRSAEARTCSQAAIPARHRAIHSRCPRVQDQAAITVPDHCVVCTTRVRTALLLLVLLRRNRQLGRRDRMWQR